jgi:hypothetical protein
VVAFVNPLDSTTTQPPANQPHNQPPNHMGGYHPPVHKSGHPLAHTSMSLSQYVPPLHTIKKKYPRTCRRKATELYWPGLSLASGCVSHFGDMVGEPPLKGGWVVVWVAFAPQIDCAGSIPRLTIPMHNHTQIDWRPGSAQMRHNRGRFAQMRPPRLTSRASPSSTPSHYKQKTP